MEGSVRKGISSGDRRTPIFGGARDEVLYLKRQPWRARFDTPDQTTLATLFEIGESAMITSRVLYRFCPCYM